MRFAQGAARIIAQTHRTFARNHEGALRNMTQDFKALWQIDPTAIYLNHGSFGACPTAILQTQSEMRAQMESQLVQFFGRDLEGLLQTAADDFGAFVGAHGCDIAWVSNATAGVNTVLRSLQFQPGDELLTIDHAYNACKTRWTMSRSNTKPTSW